ncbi:MULTISPECIES: 2-nitropropane dioxygenase [Arthrobacter]|uniref:2-nitropropane dioxygenase n=1 Tax=Arthrobacter terricola TaxID=2547396 RepID=A0A4R5L1Z4_9MICC|nr:MULTISPECIES: 2-nitropropane dioxygenase [Arthrobacter]MBT8158899.1 2-nitropropane dioxygenase [Arthrobacter sp. GN70]TDG01582.1 2-nitropropane dioxygenase [Arthrobacter terricola]
MSTATASCGTYRRPSMLESAAAGIGSSLVSWSERRRYVPPVDPGLQRAALMRRRELTDLRQDAIGAAHSGLEPRR